MLQHLLYDISTLFLVFVQNTSYICCMHLIEMTALQFSKILYLYLVRKFACIHHSSLNIHTNSCTMLHQRTSQLHKLCLQTLADHVFLDCKTEACVVSSSPRCLEPQIHLIQQYLHSQQYH